jgi:cysteine desulfurase
MSGRIYLDFNATAPLRAEALGAVTAAMGEVGNASSVHGFGRAARARVERARRQVAALVGAAPGSVIFTSGGTEANNQALRAETRPRAFAAAIEHESVLAAREDAVPLPVLPDGRADLSALERMLAADDAPAMVSLMLANNETGVIQPVAEAAAIAHRAGALLHCDAVQGAGKVPVDIAALGADLISLSAHKIGGPQGVGALIAREGLAPARFVHGGGQERGMRAGTENVAGIAGFGAAAEAAAAGLDRFAALAPLRDAMLRRLREAVPDLVVFGEGAPRLPNTAKFAAPGLTAETQVMGMDLEGIAISAGSACSAGKVSAPYVLTAMGVDDALARCAVRVSLGWTTTEAEIDTFVAAWTALWRRAGAGRARAAG